MYCIPIVGHILLQIIWGAVVMNVLSLLVIMAGHQAKAWTVACVHATLVLM